MTTTASPVQAAAVPAGVGARSRAASSASRRPLPAASAAGRAFRVSVLIGLLGLASTVIVISRLLSSWQVTARPGPHVISILGQQLSYPSANLGAIVVTVLAGVGLAIATAALLGIARELLANRGFMRALAARAPRPLRGAHGAFVIDDPRPQAFCAGLLRPRVYFSTCALELLDEPALVAVLAHERHHARRRDPLRLAYGRALARALFFLPAVRRLVRRQQALTEIGADEAAMLNAGVDRSALASAMLSFSEAAGSGSIGIDPERVDYLLGQRIRWRLPIVLCFGIAAALAVPVAVAMLLANGAAASATLAPPLLSSRPCIAIVALLATGTALASVAYARTRRARRLAPPQA
jgi:Zn-dependent protease with chaperone function